MESTMAEIAGINVQAFNSEEEFARQILPDGGSISPGFAVAINPEKIMAARRDPDTRAAIATATLRYADGIGVVWAMRRKGVRAPRVTGADLWERLMARAASRGIPVALLGARPEVLEQVTSRLRQEFPTLQIAAAQHGYASEPEMHQFTEQVKNMGSGIVAVAMGSPRQEKVIASLRQSCSQAFYMGVGGTFDCYSGVVRRAPPNWQRISLEWFYRLLRQPWRIRRQWRLVPYAALVLTGRV